MSNYLRITRNPISKKWETAFWLDDHFGNHNYGVEFEDGKVYDPRKIKLETKDGPTDKDWDWKPRNIEFIEPSSDNPSPSQGLSKLGAIQDEPEQNDTLSPHKRITNPILSPYPKPLGDFEMRVTVEYAGEVHMSRISGSSTTKAVQVMMLLLVQSGHSREAIQELFRESDSEEPPFDWNTY